MTEDYYIDFRGSPSGKLPNFEFYHFQVRKYIQKQKKNIFALLCTTYRICQGDDFRFVFQEEFDDLCMIILCSQMERCLSMLFMKENPVYDRLEWLSVLPEWHAYPLYFIIFFLSSFPYSIFFSTFRSPFSPLFSHFFLSTFLLL